MSHIHRQLVEEFSRIDKIFEAYANTHRGKKVKSVYENYRHYPEITDCSVLSSEEAKGYLTYLREHQALLDDIRDAQEFEIFTLIIGETKMDIGADKQ